MLGGGAARAHDGLGLARQLGRNYKIVHTDVQMLMEWMAVERDEAGLVGVPWTDIVVDLKLPDRVAA